jgi:hypothetical protein
MKANCFSRQTTGKKEEQQKTKNDTECELDLASVVGATRTIAV